MPEVGRRSSGSSGVAVAVEGCERARVRAGVSRARAAEVKQLLQEGVEAISDDDRDLLAVTKQAERELGLSSSQDASSHMDVDHVGTRPVRGRSHDDSPVPKCQCHHASVSTSTRCHIAGLNSFPDASHYCSSTASQPSAFEHSQRTNPQLSIP